MRYLLGLLIFLTTSAYATDYDCRDLRDRINLRRGINVQPNDELIIEVTKNFNECKLTNEEVYRAAYGDNKEPLKQYEKAYNDFIRDIDMPKDKEN